MLLVVFIFKWKGKLELPLEHYELELHDQVIVPGGSDLLPGLEVKTAPVRAVQLRQQSCFVHETLHINKMKMVKEFLDKNNDVHMRAASGLPNCTVYVVEAGFLGFTVDPGDRWILEVKREYTITVEVYDTGSTRVYLSDNLRITHHFSKECFEELLSSHNGSYHIVQVLKDGIAGIKAELVSVVQELLYGSSYAIFLLQEQVPLCRAFVDNAFCSFCSCEQSKKQISLPQKFSHEQEVKVYLPIKLSPSFLAFPHHPMEVLYYKLWVKSSLLQPGFLSLETYDLCLGFLGPVTAYLRVSDMHELVVDLTDKLEIGNFLVVTVRVLGFQLPLRSKYFRYMKLKLQAASPIVTLDYRAENEWCLHRQREEVGEYSELYVLAVAVGQTTVATAWDKMGRSLISAPWKVEVLPPFKLIPKKITLIPHNMRQVMSEGPQPQPIIPFSVTICSITEVNQLGQVTARIVGAAVIQGAIQVVSEDTGKVTVFSQIEVRSPEYRKPKMTFNFYGDNILPLQMPVSMLTPFSFGNANPELIFQWSVSKRDVLDLLPQHKELCCISNRYPFSSRQRIMSLWLCIQKQQVMYTKAAGRTSTKVTVQRLNASAGQFEGNRTELSDEVQILVFDKLLLFSPMFSTEQILMSMNSQLKLYTNREGAASVSFQVLQRYPNSSVLEECDQGLLRAGAVTGIAVLEVTYEVFGVRQTIIMEQSAE
ncbi:LOW QUALITY PROTEIN: nuclear pore membrane glycoprotein 210-like, partial [Ciconia maguari]